MQPATQDATSSGDGRPAGASADIDVASHTLGWLGAVRARFHALAHLAVAEARLAAMSAAAVCLLVAVTLVLLTMAWGLAIAGMVYALAQYGVQPWVSLPALALLHLMLAGIAAMRAISASRHVNFSATRQQFAEEQSS